MHIRLTTEPGWEQPLLDADTQTEVRCRLTRSRVGTVGVALFGGNGNVDKVDVTYPVDDHGEFVAPRPGQSCARHSTRISPAFDLNMPNGELTADGTAADIAAYFGARVLRALAAAGVTVHTSEATDSMSADDLRATLSQEPDVPAGAI